MLGEPPEPIEGGAIEMYLESLCARLQPLNDPEGADAILAEFHAHLLDAAEDLIEDGHSRSDAERIALERFGTRHAEEIAVSLAERAGQGDIAWRNVGVAFAGIVVLFLGIATKLDLISLVDVAVWFPVFFSSTLLFFGYACLKSRNLPILRHAVACATVAMTLSAMAPVPEGTPIAARASTIAAASPTGFGTLVASTDVEGIRSIVDVIQRDPRGVEGVTSDARRLASKQRLHPEGKSGQRVRPWGVVGGATFRSLTELLLILPAPCHLGAIWMFLAGMVRATCSWICRLGTWSSARPGVWVA